MHEPDRDDACRFVDGFKPNDWRRIDTKEIFRQLIAQEVRSGRLTPGRRRRIIRYAAQLHLSAVETGRLIAECRDEALESDDADVIYHDLRLVAPPLPATPLTVKVGLPLIAAIVMYILGTRFF